MTPRILTEDVPERCSECGRSDVEVAYSLALKRQLCQRCLNQLLDHPEPGEAA